MGYLPIGVHYSRSDTPKIENIAISVGYQPTQLALKTLMLKTLCTRKIQVSIHLEVTLLLPSFHDVRGYKQKTKTLTLLLSYALCKLQITGSTKFVHLCNKNMNVTVVKLYAQPKPNGWERYRSQDRNHYYFLNGYSTNMSSTPLSLYSQNSESLSLY